MLRNPPKANDARGKNDDAAEDDPHLLRIEQIDRRVVEMLVRQRAVNHEKGSDDERQIVE